MLCRACKTNYGNKAAELLACIFLSKLIVSVKKAVVGLLNVRNVFCWSNSQISLWWIIQVWEDWKVWIKNRVPVIRKNVAPEYWMYVLTDINPADVTTRLLSPNAFVSCEMWWKDPEFLHLENIDMSCHNFLRPGEVSEEQKVETVLLAGSGKFFGIGEVVVNSRFRSL